MKKKNNHWKQVMWLSTFLLLLTAFSHYNSAWARRMDSSSSNQRDTTTGSGADDRRRARERERARRDGGREKVDIRNLGGLGNILGAFESAAQRKEGGVCEDPCDAKSFPVPKHRIRPYSNGCSVPEMLRGSIGDYSHFEVCCDFHDACYGTCGVHKPFCEKEFEKCMKDQCRAMTRPYQKGACLDMADMFVAGTSTFGCSGYTASQKELCECIPTEKEAIEHVKLYVTEFYDAYNRTHPIPEHFVKKHLDLPPGTPHSTRMEKYGEMIY